MSYARFSKDCDVYIYDDYRYGLHCCGCKLKKPHGYANDIFHENYDLLIEHLHEHRKAGHKVPDYLFEILAEERDELSRGSGD